MSVKRTRDGDQLLIRFKPGSETRKRLNEAAEANRRTLSQEVIARLEASLDDVGHQPALDPFRGRLVHGEHDPIDVLEQLDAALGDVMRDVAALKAKAGI